MELQGSYLCQSNWTDLFSYARLISGWSHFKQTANSVSSSIFQSAADSLRPRTGDAGDGTHTGSDKLSAEIGLEDVEESRDASHGSMLVCSVRDVRQ